MKFKKEQVRKAYLKKLMEEHKKYATPKMADGGAVERLLTPKNQELIDEYNRMNNPDELQKALPGNIEALKDIQQEIGTQVEPIKPASSILPKVEITPDIKQPSIIEPQSIENKKEPSLFRDLVLQQLEQKQDPNTEDKYQELLKEIKKSKENIKSEQNKAGWTTAISNIASGLGKTMGLDVGPGREFKADSSESDILENKLKELKLKDALMPNKASSDKLLGYLAASERLEMAKDKEAKDREEFQKNLDLKQKQFEERIKQAYLPSAKETEVLANFDKTEALSKYIETDLLPKAEEFIGRYASKAQEAKDYIPFLEQDQDYVALKGAVTEQLSQYIKGLSGLTVSDKERAQLEQAAPKVTDKPDTFKTKLSEFQKRLGLMKQNELNALQKYRERSVDSMEIEQSKKETKLNEKDQAALKWAEANPDDPRSARIKAKLGL